jgi:hypothetical protein
MRDKLDTARRIPILITSSITPHDTGVRLADPEKRLFHALESITHWLRVAPGSSFVLCDGSNFDFQPIIQERFPNDEIECLFFENDRAKILSHGRGYGEGEIVKYALKHSAFLAESTSFAKCSSKLWVENYTKCLEEWRGNCLFSGVFKNTFSITKRTEMVQVDTRFYIVDYDFYRKHLKDAHLRIGEAAGFGLEDCFFEILKAIHQDRYLFSIPPTIRGVGGGTGTYYKDNWLRVQKEKIRLEIIKKSRNFHTIFNI